MGRGWGMPSAGATGLRGSGRPFQLGCSVRCPCCALNPSLCLPSSPADEEAACNRKASASPSKGAKTASKVAPKTPAGKSKSGKAAPGKAVEAAGSLGATTDRPRTVTRGGVSGGGGSGATEAGGQGLVARRMGRPLAYQGDPDAPELTEQERRKIKRWVGGWMGAGGDWVHEEWRLLGTAGWITFRCLLACCTASLARLQLCGHRHAAHPPTAPTSTSTPQPP